MELATIKQKIYRKALGILQIKYDDVIKNEESPAEIEYCEDNIDTACASAMSGGDYFWLISTIAFKDRLFDWLDEDGNIVVVTDETTEEEKAKLTKSFWTYHGYIYGYTCPTDLFRPFLGDGQYNFGYARKGKEIYFDRENPTLDYIMNVTKKYDDDDFWTDMPSVFIDLIAGMLAVAISPMVSPEGTFGQNALTKMQTAAAACADLNNNAVRKYVPHPTEYLQ